MRWIYESMTIDEIVGAYEPTCTIRFKRLDKTVYIEHMSGNDTHRVMDRAMEILAEQRLYVAPQEPQLRPFDEWAAEHSAAAIAEARKMPNIVDIEEDT